MLIIALALAVIGLAALVFAVVTSNALVAWVCIGASVLGVLLLIIDALAERRRQTGSAPEPSDQDEPAEPADETDETDEADEADETDETPQADEPPEVEPEEHDEAVEKPPGDSAEEADTDRDRQDATGGDDQG